MMLSCKVKISKLFGFLQNKITTKEQRWIKKKKQTCLQLVSLDDIWLSFQIIEQNLFVKITDDILTTICINIIIF